MGAAIGAARALASSLLLIGLIAGCATPQVVTDLRRDASGLPRSAELADVPFFPQEEYYCGPAALAMVLAWSGLAVTQDEIGPQVYTPGREGTLQSDILAGARRNGRLAVEVNDLRSLLTEVAAGHPVLVFQNLGLSSLPQWHYAVAIGYEFDPGNIVLHSGLEERRAVAFEVFERTWTRAGHWALVVTAPDRLPATASLDAVLTAAVAIERVGRPADAAAAYAAIARKWPDSYAAWMGLGNSRFALEEFAAAEGAFRSAIQAQPGAPQAWNNLAYALAEQGRRAEAIAAAERAVALGGSASEQYRATLREISAAPAS